MYSHIGYRVRIAKAKRQNTGTESRSALQDLEFAEGKYGRVCGEKTHFRRRSRKASKITGENDLFSSDCTYLFRQTCMCNNKILLLPWFGAWIRNALFFYIKLDREIFCLQLQTHPDTTVPTQLGGFLLKILGSITKDANDYCCQNSLGFLLTTWLINYLACHQWQFKPLRFLLQKSYHEHQQCSNLFLSDCP